ncbi:unnamed protein product [Spirodela intermedia]|uniref:ENTH domain-containing protein n=1 Tax=Spirodela intermedia TaxID=51605 RepID=A0A7I8KFU8_SPIIN|nr:unnamed protein product [Spirodela intermedia]
MDVKGKLRLALGSLKDQAAIGKAVISGQNGVAGDMDVAILRCTDRADAPVDDKYVHELLFLAGNSPGAVVVLAGKISRRLEATRDGVVALKTLVLLHRLLRGGDRGFELGLCDAHAAGDLPLDLRWFPAASFLRRYAAFLEERMGWGINAAGSLEPVRPAVPPSSGEAVLLLRRLSRCQTLLDRVVDCAPASNYVTGPDRLTRSALSIVLRESFRVYASFSEDFHAVRISSDSGGGGLRGASARRIAEKAATQTPKLRDFYDECKRIIAGKNLDYPYVRIITAGDLPAASLGGGSRRPAAPPAPSPLLLRRLETKISTEWVAFDD